MKKATLYLMFCSAVVIAYMMGYLNAQEEIGVNQPSAQEPQYKEFSLRVERYQPSCDQLKQLGRSPVVQHGNDTLFVSTTEVYFYVVGVNLSAKHAPFSYWWGGDRAAALSQCTERKK